MRQTLALYFTSAYSFETHTKKSEWSVGPLDGAIEPAPLLGNSKLSSAQWLDTDDNSILFTNSSADGQTNVWILPHMSLETVYRAATIDGPVSNLKHRVVDDTIHLIFSSLAYPNGTLYNPKKAHKPLSSGRVYESLFVRHWDEYVKDEKSSLFFGTLSRPDKKAAYKLDSDPKNLLPAGYGLESPVPPFGGSDDFDLSPDGKTVAFVSKTPGLNPATNTQSLVYLVHTDSLRFLGAINGPDNVNSPAARGASSAPTFSPDNEAIAYLQMGENGYESDINKIYVVRLGEITTPVAQDWDVSPQTIKWDANAKHVYSIADHQGRHKLFKISVKSGATEEVWGKYTVSDYQLLPDGKFLLSINSLTQSSRSYILNPSDGKLKTLQEPVGFEKALRHLQVEEFWSPGAAGGKVHSYIVKPSFFDDTKKYKMAFFIHGGPQG